jgi:hypothetical protein
MSSSEGSPPLLQGHGAKNVPNQQISHAKAKRTHDRQIVVVFMPRGTKGEGLMETPPRRRAAPKGVAVSRTGRGLAELSP